MPRLSQVMIRTALIWLGVGFTLGGLLLWHQGMPLSPWLLTLRLAHVHMLLVGWTVQLAYGVAFWIFPRLDARGARGNTRLIWLCYGMLNGGVVLAALYDPAQALVRARWIGVMPVLAGLLYVGATVAFIVNAWPRVISFRTIPRTE
jgi:hypothetical protein